MNITMTDTKDVIISLKKYATERGLTKAEDIYSFIKGDEEVSPVSLSTVRRVFKKGSEDETFRWEATLRPLAEALLDIDQVEQDDDAKTQSYKSFLKLKRDIIAEKDAKIAELEEKLKQEKEKYLEQLAKETAKFQKSLDFATHQISLKDGRIDQLMQDNSKLVNHILDCPYRKECK